MNSISAPSLDSGPSSSAPIIRQCCGRINGTNGVNLCRKKVVWTIDGVGDMCNYCFTIYHNDNWRRIDLDRVHRLSDNEHDFHCKPERRKSAHNGNGNGHK